MQMIEKHTHTPEWYTHTHIYSGFGFEAGLASKWVREKKRLFIFTDKIQLYKDNELNEIVWHSSVINCAFYATELVFCVCVPVCIRETCESQFHRCEIESYSLQYVFVVFSLVSPTCWNICSDSTCSIDFEWWWVRVFCDFFPRRCCCWIAKASQHFNNKNE